MSLKRSAMLITFLALLGLALSSWLTSVHVRAHIDPFYSSICAVSETFNCEMAAASRYSVVAGLPVSIVGILFYLFAVFVGLFEIIGKEHSNNAGWLVVMGGASSVASLALAAVSAVHVDAFCLPCVTVYAVNFISLGLSLARTRQLGGPRKCVVSQIAKMRRDYWSIVFASLVAAMLVIAGPGRGFPRYWELAAWRSGLHMSSGYTEDGLPWLGAKNPTLIIHEYFDYECPACRVSHKKLRRTIAPHADRIRLVRHDLPRVSCETPTGGRRKNPCAMTLAARCAGLEGRYWEWNDAAIAHSKTQRDLGKLDFETDLASAIGFKREELTRCMADHATNEHARRLTKAAISAGIRFTPTYLLDGEKMDLVQLTRAIKDRMR